MKALMLSVRPQWCKLIAGGQKTIEVRKTVPKISPPFKCFIYQTRSGKVPTGLFTCDGEIMGRSVKNGKVIGAFVCDGYVRFGVGPLDGQYMIFPNDLAEACMTGEEFERYGNGKMLYGWHISHLKIYDRPKELSEFYYNEKRYCEHEICEGCPKYELPDANGEYAFCCEWERPITRAPQSWCYIG